MSSCLLSVFLVSLDRTILATAVPYITDAFHSIDDISWYASAYMLTNASLQLLYGKIYQLFPAKPVLLCAIVLFEIGSAVCGSAPSSLTLIIGRAIAGAGSGGVMGGVMQTIVILIPLHKRPVYNAMFSALFAISSVVGPLIGGALTEKLSWRWCFYINLPCGAVSIVAVLLLMKAHGQAKPPVTARELWNKLDLLGLVLFIPSISSLIIALQWGVDYQWSDGRVIALLVVFGVTLIAWMAVQAWKKDNATVPPRIFFQRTIAAGFAYSFLLTSAIMLMIYYMPIWFQAVKGVSPVTSGLYFLPFILSMSLSAILSGVFTQRIGYYNPSMIASAAVLSVGTGLATTFTTHTGSSHWAGYEFLCGFGGGMAMQQAGLAAQAVLPLPDVPIGIALMFFGQLLGGSVFLAVAQSVFTQQLVKRASGIAGLDPETIINSGATELRGSVPASQLPRVLAAYNGALTDTWYVAVALSSAALIPTLCMEWKSIKGLKRGRRGLGPGSNPAGKLSEKAKAPPAASDTNEDGGVIRSDGRPLPDNAA
ncbi:Major facilitator superfamily protein [Pleurostoma richardsiae]|uniref:Major facilitator superfamily protein n=1 Tax=Pleurostoma richardsiae TaxID=41990 RepID=A0AA38RPB5_9PEZI|nr:Major facilitator superfamily protein [Pleurostoma richardsiae]